MPTNLQAYKSKRSPCSGIKKDRMTTIRIDRKQFQSIQTMGQRTRRSATEMLEVLLKKAISEEEAEQKKRAVSKKLSRSYEDSITHSIWNEDVE